MGVSCIELFAIRAVYGGINAYVFAYETGDAAR